MPFEVFINGRPTEVDVPADMPLLRVIRDVLNLHGTKFGCVVALCGACTVDIDGELEPVDRRLTGPDFHDRSLRTGRLYVVSPRARSNRLANSPCFASVLCRRSRRACKLSNARVPGGKCWVLA